MKRGVFLDFKKETVRMVVLTESKRIRLLELAEELQELVSFLKEDPKHTFPRYIPEFSTKELVDELKKREGVESMFIEPHESKDLHVDGFATVLIAID